MLEIVDTGEHQSSQQSRVTCGGCTDWARTGQAEEEDSAGAAVEEEGWCTDDGRSHVLVVKVLLVVRLAKEGGWQLLH